MCRSARASRCYGFRGSAANYHMVIVEGTAYDDLKKGPGHYPGTALPGQVGKLCGCRPPQRRTFAPFSHIDKLSAGDAIVLETKSMWFTYTVEDAPRDLGLSAGAVERDRPRRPTWRSRSQCPTSRTSPPRPKLKLLTFTSCNPKYSAVSALRHPRCADPGTAKSPADVLPPALGG